MKETIVTKNNFATLINAGKISNDALTSFNTTCRNYSTEISEMVIREQHDREVINNISSVKETIGIGTDVAKDIINKSVNAELASQISYKVNENKTDNITEGNYSGSYNLNETNDSSLKNQIVNIVKNNEDVLRENKVFSEDEFNKILNGGQGDVKELFDYSLGVSNGNDMQMDFNILDKCYGCDLKNDSGEYIFKNFKIVDGSGTAVNPELINKFNVKLILNFGMQDSLKDINNLSIINLKATSELKDRCNKLSKLKSGGNLLKLSGKLTGVDLIKREFKQYTDQYMKPYRALKKGAKVAETGVSLAYKGAKASILMPDNNALKKAIKNNDLEKADRIRKTLAKKNKAFNKVEGTTSKILHPLRNIKNSLLNKYKSSSMAKKMSSKVKSSLLGKVYGSLNKHLGNAFRIVGKVTTPIYLIMRKIITAVIVTMLPVFIILIIFIVTGVLGISSADVGSVIAIMPLANQRDFDNYQKKYNELDDNFLKSLEEYLANYAVRRNLKGELIRYGINGQNNEEGMTNDDFYNGMYYRFITDEEHEGRSSNIEDIIATMAIMMSQSQADYPDIALSVIEWLYDISHSYTYTESPLYACDSACHNIEYKCTDIYHKYSDSDIKYNPFHAIKKSGGEYEILEPNVTCDVCNKIKEIKTHLNSSDNNYDSHINHILSYGDFTEEDYMWCNENSENIDTCYHGRYHDTSGNSHYISSERPSAELCNNPERDVYYTYWTDSDGNEHEEAHPYYYCGGHSHKACAGHNYKCCLGHCDIQMNVQIKFFDEMKEVINDYEF